MPPYCFECMIALVKADDFISNIQSSNSKQHFRFSVGGYRMFYSQLILCTQTGFCSLRTFSLYDLYYISCLSFPASVFLSIQLSVNISCLCFTDSVFLPHSYALYITPNVRIFDLYSHFRSFKLKAHSLVFGIYFYNILE